MLNTTSTASSTFGYQQYPRGGGNLPAYMTPIRSRVAYGDNTNNGNSDAFGFASSSQDYFAASSTDFEYDLFLHGLVSLGTSRGGSETTSGHGGGGGSRFFSRFSRTQQSNSSFTSSQGHHRHRQHQEHQPQHTPASNSLFSSIISLNQPLPSQQKQQYDGSVYGYHSSHKYSNPLGSNLSLGPYVAFTSNTNYTSQTPKNTHHTNVGLSGNAVSSATATTRHSATQGAIQGGGSGGGTRATTESFIKSTWQCQSAQQQKPPQQQQQQQPCLSTPTSATGVTVIAEQVEEIESSLSHQQLHALHRFRRQKKKGFLSRIRDAVISFMPKARHSIIERHDLYTRYGDEEKAALEAFAFLDELPISMLKSAAIDLDYEYCQDASSIDNDDLDLRIQLMDQPMEFSVEEKQIQQLVVPKAIVSVIDQEESVEFETIQLIICDNQKMMMNSTNGTTITTVVIDKDVDVGDVNVSSDDDSNRKAIVEENNTEQQHVILNANTYDQDIIDTTLSITISKSKKSFASKKQWSSSKKKSKSKSKQSKQSIRNT